MTNIVIVAVSTVLLIILFTTFSVPLAEAGVISHELDIRLFPSGLEMAFDSEPVEMISLEEGTEVKICNQLFEGNVPLIIRVNGVVVFNLTLRPRECVQDILGEDFHVGDTQLPSGGLYKVSEGSILIDGCPVIPGQPTIFSLGTCQVDGQGVGGEILPIEVTALLIAGVQSTTWIIPVVLSVIGIGLVLVRRK